MQKQISRWNSRGDDVCRVYDDETADMEEVNQYMHDLEKQFGAKAFDAQSGEQIDKLTKEHSGVSLVSQMCGG